MDFLKQQVTAIPPTTTEAASELQVLAANNEPAVVYESKDFSLTQSASDNLSAEEPTAVVVHESKDFSLKKIISDNLSAEVEVEEPAVEGVTIAMEQNNSSIAAIPQPMTGTGLAKRLTSSKKKPVSQSTVSRQKDNGNESFFKWSKNLDPDKIGWRYDPDIEDHYKFFPVLDTPSV